MDLISRKAAIKIVRKNDFASGASLGKHSGIAEIIKDEIAGLPSIHAVPLDKLCEWLARNALDITRRNITPLKEDAEHWRKLITKWMEGLDGTD